MKRKPFLAIVSVMIVALLILGFKVKGGLQSEAQSLPGSEIESSEMSREEREIADAIIAAYRQLEYATLTFDTSELSTVFVDDLRFPLSDELHREVEIAFGDTPDRAGYLTYMEAWYKNWERGRLWRAFLVKKAEGWYIANRVLLEAHY